MQQQGVRVQLNFVTVLVVCHVKGQRGSVYFEVRMHAWSMSAS